MHVENIYSKLPLNEIASLQLFMCPGQVALSGLMWLTLTRCQYTASVTVNSETDQTSAHDGQDNIWIIPACLNIFMSRGTGSPQQLKLCDTHSNAAVCS